MASLAQLRDIAIPGDKKKIADQVNNHLISFYTIPEILAKDFTDEFVTEIEKTLNNITNDLKPFTNSVKLTEESSLLLNKPAKSNVYTIYLKDNNTGVFEMVGNSGGQMILNPKNIAPANFFQLVDKFITPHLDKLMDLIGQTKLPFAFTVEFIKEETKTAEIISTKKYYKITQPAIGAMPVISHDLSITEALFEKFADKKNAKDLPLGGLPAGSIKKGFPYKKPATTGENTENPITEKSNSSVTRPAKEPVNSFTYACKNGVNYSIEITKEVETYTVSVKGKGQAAETALKQENEETVRTFFFKQILSPSNLKQWMKNETICGNDESDIVKLTDDINNKIVLFEKDKNVKILADSLFNVAERFKDVTRVAGVIRLKNIRIPLYNHTEDKGKNRKEKESQKLPNEKYRFNPLQNSYIEIKKVRVQTDYNRISDMTIYCTVFINNKNMGDHVIDNPFYSLSFFGLNRGYYSAYMPEPFKEFGINYADILMYIPKNEAYTKIVKNEEVWVGPEKRETEIHKRSYSDYLSVRGFLDPLGFIDSLPNGFAQVEGTVIVPLYTFSTNSWNWVPQMSASFNYIYANSVNQRPRFARTFRYIDSTRLPAPDSFRLTKVNYLRNLDLFRNSHYNFNFKFSIAAWERKHLQSWLHLEAGFHVVGAKIELDSGASYVIKHKFIPDINFRFEARPDNIFGATLNAGIMFLGKLHRGNNDPGTFKNPSFLYRQSLVIPHDINVYMFLGNNDGGLFFRYSGFLAFNRKNDIDLRPLQGLAEYKRTEYFPQLLFGYSTNLSSIIKKSAPNKD